MRAACFSVTLLLALPAAAQEGASAGATLDAGSSSSGAAPDSPTLPGALVVGGEFGAIFPQPFTELGTHVAFGLELGYRLPFADQRLEALFAVGYSPPGNSATVARPEGEYDAKVTQQMLHFSLGPRVHFLERRSPFNVTGALGPRLFLLKSTSSGGRGGNDFAEFKEQSTQLGFFLTLGGEYLLGPGALFVDLDLGYAKLPHEITGRVNAGNLTGTLGYRFFLL
jgi:hypothetical protein